MSEKYKLGLTRNRLFEFDNCVLFCAKPDFEYDFTEVVKALKALCIKEPLITSRIELLDDGTAFAVTDSVKQGLEKIPKNKDAILNEFEENGIDFWEQSFKFCFSDDGYLIIAGHTAVCDAKSLFRLAVGLLDFYKKGLVGIEPSEINLCSDFSSLPIQVASPITDKLSVEIDSKWDANQKPYSLEDYKTARALYVKNKPACGELQEKLGSDVLSELVSYCGKNNLDVSSVVAFAFYDVLVKRVGIDKKYNKMNVYADSRFFFNDYRNIGAFNGVVTADLNKKEFNAPLNERVKKFHLDCYKGSTSVFKVFYDDYFLMKVSPVLCDSAYMYRVGLCKNKASKKLAENYGCAYEKICDFFSCNLDQRFWEGLAHYSKVEVFEPLKMRSSNYVGFIRRNGEGYITFKYKKDKCNDSLAKIIIQDAINLIFEIIKN